MLCMLSKMIHKYTTHDPFEKGSWRKYFGISLLEVAESQPRLKSAMMYSYELIKQYQCSKLVRNGNKNKKSFLNQTKET